MFPETLLESPDPTEEGSQWMVIYTKPRQEKSLARDLLRQTIPFYLPVVKKDAAVWSSAIAIVCTAV